MGGGWSGGEKSARGFKSFWDLFWIFWGLFFEWILTIDFDAFLDDFGSQKGVTNHEQCYFFTLLAPWGASGLVLGGLGQRL